MKKKSPVIVALILVLAPAALRGQSPAGGEDYKTMLEEALKSGKYGQNQNEDWDARVKKISGDVRVKDASSEEWAALEGVMPLNSADSIKTGDGVAEVYLDDKGSITVGRNTELELSSLAKGESVFSIKFGNIAAKIRHFLDEKLKMQVRTPSAVCAVRGTEFAVEYSQLGKDTGAAVFDEGRLAVSPLDDKDQPISEYLLEKNTELTFTPVQKRFRPVPLARMSRYRSSIAAMRLRLVAIKKTWKPSTAAKREAIRSKIFKRNVIRREIDEPKPKPKSLKKKNKSMPRAGKTIKNRARRKAGAAAP
ncbi:MAG: hypothetical protein A2270_06480 [Elusimicrobia bacterium RIFOXYA12_FULL_51_18]|nr:MAG: hypothetical protein A2270_06480 [Elusimicrobia bacterium RIFOXYA12_FULL_51_18]OGS29431.1 MAG: hypothetical protein A2218_00300 [Elusimicrobia bacterium RIFOXYA2_FULL_53_38]